MTILILVAKVMKHRKQISIYVSVYVSFKSLVSHFCSSLGELVTAKQDVFLPGDPERGPGLVQPQHVVILGRDLGHVGPHRRVPAVVTRGVGTHVDQVTREAGDEALKISVAA